AQLYEIFVVEPSLAVCRSKTALSKGNKLRRAQLEAHMPVAFQLLARDPLQPWIGRIQSAVDYLVHRLAETRLIEAQVLRQFGKHPHIAFGLTDWGDRLIRDLQIIVSVCVLQVLVLEERGRGQNDVGVVSGIAEELLVHYGEQIGTTESPHNVIVIGRDRRRIRVVYKDGFHRRMVQLR